MVMGPSGYGPGLSAHSGLGSNRIFSNPRPSDASVLPAQQFGNWFHAAAEMGGAPAEVRQAASAWSGLLRSGSQASLIQSFNSLPPSQQRSLRNYFGTIVPALLDLSEESDAQIFYSDLIHIARQNRQRHGILSGIIIRDLAEGDLMPSLPASIRGRAQVELQVLHGEGPLAMQLERLSEGFVAEVANPSLIAGLAAGSLVSSGVRLGMMSRFARLPSVRLLSNHTAAYLTAQSAAFVAEVPTIYLASHSVAALLNPNIQFTDFHGASQEMLSLAAMLGFLKAGGALFRGIFNLGHGVHPLTGRIDRAQAFTRWSQPASQQLGMFSGLYGFHRLGSVLGIHEEMNPTQALYHSLRTLVQFNAAGALANGILGSGYAGALRRMESNTQQYRWRMRMPNIPSLRPRALTPEGLEIPIPDGENNPLRDNLILMSGKESESSYPPPASGKPFSGVRQGRPVNARSRVEDIISDPQEAAILLPKLGPRKIRSLLKAARERNSLVQLILGRERLMDTGELQVDRAQEKLQSLEGEFLDFVETRRRDATEKIQRDAWLGWVNSLESEGGGWRNFGRTMLKLGFNEFDQTFKIRGRMADFKFSTWQDPSVREYFYDLGLVREFLNHHGLNNWVGMEGSFLSNLILTGDGHCVSKSLLFTHFASLLGHSLELGQIPGHVYLRTKSGGAIETTAQFALLPNNIYQVRSNNAEVRTRRSSDVVGFYMLHMGLQAIKGGRLSQGRESFEMAEKILPNSATTLFHWGQYYQASFNFVEAARAFQQYVELSGENPNAWEKALAQLKILNNVSPDTSEIYDAMAVIYRKMGKVQEAEEVETIRDLMAMPDIE